MRRGRIAEEGVENRPGDHVLGQHLDRFVFRDAGIEVVAELVQEFVEDIALRLAGFDDDTDTLDVRAGDAGDVAGPLLPIAAVAALLDDLSADRFGKALEDHRLLLRVLDGRAIGIRVRSRAVVSCRL